MKALLKTLVGAALLLTVAAPAPAVTLTALHPAIRILKPLAPLPVDAVNLYLTQTYLADIEQLKQDLPGLSTSYTPDKTHWKQARIQYGTQTVILKRETLSNQVSSRKQDLSSLLSRLDPAKTLKVTQDIGLKVPLVKQVVSASSSNPDDPKWAELVSGLAQLWHGTINYRDELLDNRLRVLLARAADHEPGSEVPYFPSALNRRARSEAILKARKVQVHKSLPPVVAEEELVTMPARQVFERGMTLLVLGSTTTTLTRREGAERLREWGLLHELTPGERAYLADEDLTDEELNAMNWRFESAYALLWSVGVAPDAGYPSDLSNLPGLLTRVKSRSFSRWLHEARFRPSGQILDRLDLTRRLQRAISEQQTQGWKPYPNLNPAVNALWQHALSWVVKDSSPWQKNEPTIIPAPAEKLAPPSEPVPEPALDDSAESDSEE